MNDSRTAFLFLTLVAVVLSLLGTHPAYFPHLSSDVHVFFERAQFFVEHLSLGELSQNEYQPGAILYFPVHAKGGLLYLGDCHAAQGDGELCGVAVEQAATVTLEVDLIKNWSFAWPRLETERFIMCIGSARPLEDAARIAYRELTRWMASDYGFDELDAYMLLTQAGRVRLGNMVDPKYTVGASILKRYVEA